MTGGWKRSDSGRRVRGPGRGRLERRVRGAWGDPGSPLRALAAVYGAVADLRNLLWEAGVFTPQRVDAAVISVGGLSTGGAGKTPVTASLARCLADAGAAVAVVTPGQGDELQLHAELNPDVPALGARWRIPVAGEAVRRGATVILLDSGFQHRRLHRDLELVTFNVDQMGSRDRLPAGPYRERFTALRRADGVLLVRRAAPPSQAEALAAEVLAVAPGALVAHVSFEAAGLRPGNAAARTVDAPDPAVAVAGVMWPEAFFRWLPRVGIRPERRFALPDHARYDPDTVERIARAAGPRGVVCTRKDTVRLAPRLPEEIPVWWLDEKVRWGAGCDVLLAGVRRVAGVADGTRAETRRAT